MEELEKKIKTQKIGIIILLILLLATVGLSYYYICIKENNEKTDNQENEEVVEKIYSYGDVEGVYSLTKEFDVEGNKEKGTYTLYLWKDGTFKCQYSIFAPVGYIGNYIIEDNKIILNYLFGTNSGTGLTVKSGNITLNIEDENSIELTNASEYSGFDFSGLLIKDNSQESTTKLEELKINKVLDNNDAFINKVSEARSNNNN